jgi:hypothetical protein
LDLGGVQVHGDDVVGAGHGEEICDESVELVYCRHVLNEESRSRRDHAGQSDVCGM